MAKFIRAYPPELIIDSGDRAAYFKTEVYPLVVVGWTPGESGIEVSLEFDDAPDRKIGTVSNWTIHEAETGASFTEHLLMWIDTLCVTHWLGRCFGQAEGREQLAKELRDTLGVQ